MLNYKQLGVLLEVERKYDCTLYFPPFKNRSDCCFFDINKLQDDSIKFREFLVEIKKAKLSHEFIDVKGKKFIVVAK